MAKRRISLLILRIFAFIISIPSFIILAPFSAFLFFKFKNYFKRLEEKIKKTDVHDIKTDLTAAEVEYASDAMKGHGFPTKNGFVGELLRLNASNDISIDLVSNKLFIKRSHKERLPDYLQENDADKMYESWKRSAGILNNKSFMIGGNYVFKTSLWCLVAINFVLTFFLMIALIILGGILYTITSIILAFIQAFGGYSFSGAVWSAVISLIMTMIILNIIAFLLWHLFNRWNYDGKEESFKKMAAEYEKSIILNVILNKLEDGFFKEKSSLSYFLMYEQYGAFAVASHASKKLDVDKLKFEVQ